MRRLRYGKFGLAEDPKGVHVTMPWQGRDLLGEVVDVYREEPTGSIHLVVRHFNGEPWPVDPIASVVWVVEREGAAVEGKGSRMSGSGLGQQRRKSMTFGVLPPFDEFEEAFDAAMEEDETRCYKIRLGGGVTSVALSPTILGDGCYNAKDLYKGIQELIRIWEGDVPEEWAEDMDREDPEGRYDDGEIQEEAGSFASGIMETLGYEWV